MAKLRASPDDLFALVAQASEGLNISQEFVEKDYWVTELLRSVAQPVDDAIIIFKGGTSLSKAFGLIERFSEDVDILVSIRDETFGKGRVHKILRNICERAGDDLDIASENRIDKGSEAGVHRNVRYLYPARLAPEAVTEGVLLEMGRRGGDLPRDRQTLTSMVAAHAINNGVVGENEFDEFQPFEIDVLAPERTLVEKLALLHRLSLEDDGEALGRNGRHLYDVYKLLTSDQVASKLRADPTTVPRLAADADEQSERWERPVAPRPETGYASSPAFDASGSRARFLRQGLEAARLLIYGDAPTFERCLEAVASSADLL